MSALLLIGLTAAAARAQNFAPLQPGELLANGQTEEVKVLQCRNTAYAWRECETVVWKNGRADSNPAWWDERMLVQGDARVRQALGRPPRAGGGAGAPAAVPGRSAVAPQTPAPRGRAAGGRIPDGAYRCQTWMGNAYVNLGTVRSIGGSLDTGLLRKVGATFTGATATPSGVTINYLTARGYRESMDCTRQ